MALELWDLGYNLEKIRVLAEGTLHWAELGYPFTATED